MVLVCEKDNFVFPGRFVPRNDLLGTEHRMMLS